MLKRVGTLLFLLALASSSLLLTGRIAGAQDAGARIADAPIRAENLSSPIIAILNETAPVDLVDLPSEQTPARPPVPAAPAPGPIAAPTGIMPQTSIIQKSRSGGFFVGTGFEGNGIVANVSGNSRTESGVGGALVLGYGFSPHWSLYGELSTARINTGGNGTYSLTHADVGARVHFLAPTHTVVPFIQGGLSGRGLAQTGTSYSGSQTVSASGTGVFFGGGVNVHITPAVAFSGGVTWSVVAFRTYTVDNQSAGPGVSNASARMHLGVIWFPRAYPAPNP
jgi:hypothetical protein